MGRADDAGGAILMGFFIVLLFLGFGALSIYIDDKKHQKQREWYQNYLKEQKEEQEARKRAATHLPMA